MKKLTLFFWLIFIFIMSQMDSNSSSILSKGMIKLLGVTLNYHYVLRKFAHAFEFFILGILVFRVTKGSLISMIFPIMYAFFDEIHQFFIPGRFMFIGDIVIDSTGIIFAFILYRFYLYTQRHFVKN